MLDEVYNAIFEVCINLSPFNIGKKLLAKMNFDKNKLESPSIPTKFLIYFLGITSILIMLALLLMISTLLFDN